MSEIKPELLQAAKEQFEVIKKYFEANKWACQVDDENMVLRATFNGHDLPMPVVFSMNPNVQAVYLYSPMNFTVNPDKQLEIAMGCLIANQNYPGKFTYDLQQNEIYYQVSEFYAGITLTPEILDTMLDLLTYVVDKYNDKFMVLSNGTIDLQKFIELTSN